MSNLFILEQERDLVQAQIDACFKALPPRKAALATERARAYREKLDEAMLAYRLSRS